VAAAMAGYCCIYHVNMINSPQEGLFGLKGMGLHPAAP
jgi:hypothetical protein